MSKIKFETTNCDLCKSDNFKKLYSSKDYFHEKPGLFSIVQCRNCGLVYTNPRPAKNSMKNFYSKSAGYFIPKISKDQLKFRKKLILKYFFNYFPEEKRSMIAKMTLFPLYFWNFRQLKNSGIPNFVQNGTLLDIGSSYGNFMYEMKKLGWQVKGLEINKKASNWGRKNLKLDISCSDIDTFKTKDKYDVITMRMLLEHVYSPTHVFKKIRMLLKPEGVLIIIIPDFNGFESKLYNKYAYTLQLPTHLTHFTPKTIKRYLINSGFNNIKIFHQNFDRDFIAPLEYMRRDKKRTKAILFFMSQKIIRITIIKIFIKIMSFFGKTSRMTIYAKK